MDIDPTTKQPVTLDTKTNKCGAGIYHSDTNTIGINLNFEIKDLLFNFRVCSYKEYIMLTLNQLSRCYLSLNEVIIILIIFLLKSFYL